MAGKFSVRGAVESLCIILALLYAGIGFVAYFFSDKIIFQPQPSSYRDTEQILKLNLPDSSRISALYLSNSSATYTVLFSHGNAEDLGDMLPFLEELRRLGFSVFAYDYPSYGTSTGIPTEYTAYLAGDAAYNYLLKELNTAPEHIIAFGRSIGGAVALDLASRKPVGGLIVESSFVTAFRVLTHLPLFPFDKFRNIDKIKQVKCPVLVVHGKDDEIIAFWHGQKLFEEAHEPKVSLWVDKAHHNDVAEVAGERYFRTLQGFSTIIKKAGG